MDNFVERSLLYISSEWGYLGVFMYNCGCIYVWVRVYGFTKENILL